MVVCVLRSVVFYISEKILYFCIGPSCTVFIKNSLLSSLNEYAAPQRGDQYKAHRQSVISVDDMRDTLALCSKYGQCTIPERLLGREYEANIAAQEARTAAADGRGC